MDIKDKIDDKSWIISRYYLDWCDLDKNIDFNETEMMPITEFDTSTIDYNTGNVGDKDERNIHDCY